jgi:hypothetical protein
MAHTVGFLVIGLINLGAEREDPGTITETNPVA